MNILRIVMAPNEDAAPEQMELACSADTDEAKLEAKRVSLLSAINSSQLNTIEERVAWLLNQFPKTRDSDINLQIRYWQHFQSDRFGGGEIAVSDYYRLAKLTTLTRARHNSKITDLFTSSVGRQLNAPGERRHAKDQFADYFLAKLKPTSITQSEAVGDMTAHIVL